jgi:hypothetical protein
MIICTRRLTETGERQVEFVMHSRIVANTP